jgi:dipeptidyl aminopeptidase/acylaminoacyl peptidase
LLNNLQIQHEANSEFGVDIIPNKPIYLDANEIARKLIMESPNSVNATTNLSNSINNKFLIKIYPILDGKYGYFRQIALIPFNNKKPIGITIGRSEVTEILGWDEKNQTIFYMAAPERRPGQRHLYKIALEFEILESFSNNINIRTANGVGPVCLTCDNSVDTFDLNNTFNFNNVNSQENQDDNLIPETINILDLISKNSVTSESDMIPNNCLYNKIHLSHDYSYYIQECLGPDTPSIYLVDSMMAKKIFIINRGEDLAEHVREFAMPDIKTFSVEIKNGFHAQVRMFMPPGMKEDEEVSLPLVLHIDASPGSQLVSEKFNVDWNWYLASQKNFIVAQIDGRGSGFQGDAFRSQIKGNISVVDVEDQATVLT